MGETMRRVLPIIVVVIIALIALLLLFPKRATQETVTELRNPTANLTANEPSILYLHSRIAGKCAWLFAQHEHETFVTRDSAAGPRYAVQRLDLYSNIGGDQKSMACSGTSACGRTEKEYNTGCRRSCTNGKATHPGFGSWSTNQVCIW